MLCQTKSIEIHNRRLIMVTNFMLFVLFLVFFRVLICLLLMIFNILREIKEQMSNCRILGDRGYLSSEIQLDLFNSVKIK